ncbi:MAG: diguanylate cyclase [Elusimicrobiota bacterium]|jgi:diguanylate cyclase (GGDEF)-like protein
MNLFDGDLLAGGLALVPAFALWGAWPRRRWMSWAGAIVCFLLWGAGFAHVSAAAVALWVGVGAWSMLACLYAAYVVERNAAEYGRLSAMLEGRSQKRGALQAQVAGSRGKSREIETEQREVLALYGMVKGLSESLTWNDLRPKLELAVQQYLRVEEFALYVVAARAQDDMQPLLRRRISAGVGASWEALQRCLQERKLALTSAHALTKPERAIAVPIFDAKRLVGYFYARVPDALEPEALKTKAVGFVEEMAFAFRRIRLFQEVEELSQTDGLTGVYRRAMFDERLREEVVRAKTFRTTFCLMMLDIDHFKELNDSYGHPFGDQVLRRIGEILRASVYETDFVARYGGEEFAVLLPRADVVGVMRKAEALRKAVEDEVFDQAGSPVRTAVSIGIAHFPRDADSVETIVSQADQALYHAKESGRNRVIDISVVRKDA